MSMKVVFKILALILLALTVTSCELFDPKLWNEVNRENDMLGREYNGNRSENSRPYCLVDEHGRMKECRSYPYENRRLINCSSKYSSEGKVCKYADY